MILSSIRHRTICACCRSMSTTLVARWIDGNDVVVQSLCSVCLSAIAEDHADVFGLLKPIPRSQYLKVMHTEIQAERHGPICERVRIPEMTPVFNLLAERARLQRDSGFGHWAG